MYRKLVWFILWSMASVYGLPITDDGFEVDMDGLAQAMTSHFQFDHLETFKQEASQAMARQLTSHLQIVIEPGVVDPLERMDLEILRSQMSAAIQAHMEGRLPWEDAQSRQAIRAHARTLLQTLCPTTAPTIHTRCLMTHATPLALGLANYTTQHLQHLSDRLQHVALPALLHQATQDLHPVLTHFNSLFLSPPFVLRVLPWTPQTLTVKPLDVHRDSFVQLAQSTQT
ncbi:hypothetical protein BY458DRAFT_513755 [Sporodiniella umbellata]|nr:hypothetical protein BY458DRAFT_513755 [Sporodiniella umbellata]